MTNRILLHAVIAKLEGLGRADDQLTNESFGKLMLVLLDTANEMLRNATPHPACAEHEYDWRDTCVTCRMLRGLK